MVQLLNITKQFDQKTVLSDLSLSVLQEKGINTVKYIKISVAHKITQV